MTEERMTPQDISEATTLKLPVDPEPAGLRLLLIFILLVGVIAGYSIATAIFSLAACSLIGLFAGLGVGIGSMLAGERFIKPYWPATRFIELSFSSFDYVDGGKQEQRIDPMQPYEAVMWRFEVPRRTRVPKGWYVVAIALEQDDTYLPVYTLISPQEFEQMQLSEHFVRLKSRQELEADSGKSLRIAGQQRRLLRAETARNLHGAEMVNADFETYLAWLNTHFPEKMTTN